MKHREGLLFICVVKNVYLLYLIDHLGYINRCYIPAQYDRKLCKHP